MDHAEALRLRAAERYLLGDLEEDIRESYEEHFFSCSECSADIRAAMALATAARELTQTEAVRGAGTWPRWISWFRPVIAVPALAVLVGVIAYQNYVTIPNMKRSLSQARTPQAVKSLSLLAANSRGTTQPHLQVSPGLPFLLLVDIPPGRQEGDYFCEIERNGAPVFSITVSVQEARDTVQILVPGSLLPTGNYTVVVRQRGHTLADSGNFVAQYPFSIEVGQ